MLKPPPDHVLDPEAHEPSAFYIQATASSSRPRHTLKHGDTFLVCDSHGDMGTTAGGSDGVFNHDTRFLSRVALLIGGQEPLLLGSTVRDDNVSLAVDLTNPDFYVDGRNVLQRDTVHIVRNLFIWENVAYQRVHLVNYGTTEAAFDVALMFACDFADLFEVRGSIRAARGMVHPVDVQADRAVMRYRGLDDEDRVATLMFDPAPGRLTADTASYHARLAPGADMTFTVALECRGDSVPRPAAFIASFNDATRRQRQLVGATATIETSNELFDEMMRRAVVDLAMLTSDTPQGPYPYAGIPWFSTAFGRDGIITALQMLWANPSIARGVLRRLAHLQADGFDPLSDAEPGKILHEMRGGEMAALREVPFGLYYGAADSTPLFLILLGQYVARTDDTETLEALWPHAERALAWMATSGDRDGDGFLEYQRETDKGLQNQCWKDSNDSIFHADGRIPDGPLAVAEIQGYAFAAYEQMADCANRLGREVLARELREKAVRLRERFEAAFWCDDIGTYAVALDGAKQPCRVRTSNAGQVLWSGIANAERARRVADGLVSADFFSGWGVRTLARGEARYNPMSYHDGSIWPHDNSLIAAGMARYGHIEHVEKVFQGLFDAAAVMNLRRMPELFCGFRRRGGAGPISYPVACAPQAWAAATPLLLLQSCLGLTFEPRQTTIRFRRPRLPRFLDRVTLRNLALGAARVDVTLQRAGDHVALSVERNAGDVAVLIEA